MGAGWGLPIDPTDLVPIQQESDCIESLEYHIEEQQLVIHFKKRGSYVYYDFPPDEFANLNGASSRGTYFNLYLKNSGYAFERIA